MLKKYYVPYQFIFESNSFKRISKKKIIYINENFERKFSFTLPRNVYLFQIKVNHLDFLYILNHDRGL